MSLIVLLLVILLVLDIVLGAIKRLDWVVASFFAAIFVLMLLGSYGGEITLR